jgi:hypothetical protein
MRGFFFLFLFFSSFLSYRDQHLSIVSSRSINSIYTIYIFPYLLIDAFRNLVVRKWLVGTLPA